MAEAIVSERGTTRFWFGWVKKYYYNTKIKNLNVKVTNERSPVFTVLKSIKAQP
jgi:hypothetical protein